MLEMLLPSTVIDFTAEAAKQNLIPSVDTTNLFGNYISVIVRAIMIVNILAVFLFLIWGATEYILASGDKGKVEEARGKMTGAIIGAVILAATIAIFTLVQGFLGVDALRFHFGGGSSGSSGPSGSSAGSAAGDLVGPLGIVCYCKDTNGSNAPCADQSRCCGSAFPTWTKYVQDHNNMCK